MVGAGADLVQPGATHVDLQEIVQKPMHSVKFAPGADLVQAGATIRMCKEWYKNIYDP